MAIEDQYLIPPNEPTIDSYIDADQVRKTTPQGYAPTPYEQDLINNYNQQFSPAAIGPQGAGLYPGIGHDINVGNYSGSIVGSNGIYVPGGNILAVDPILARKKAIDDAAKKRAAELSKPFEYQKPKAFKDPRYQQKMNDAVFGFQDQKIKEAKELYGENWRALIKDQSTKIGRELVQGLSNYETIVSNTDAITDMVAEIDEGLKDKSIYLTPSQAQTYNEYKKMLGNFEDFDKIANSDFEQLHSQLVAARDFNDYLNKSGVLSKLEAQVNQTYSVNDKGEYYNILTNKKTSYTDIINDLSKSLAETTFSNEIRNGVYTEEQLRGALDARLKNSVERSGSLQQKNEASVGRGREEQIPDLQTGFVRYTNTEEGKGIVKINNYDERGNIRGENTFRSLADFNMSVLGPKNSIFVRDDKGKLIEQNFNGLRLNDLQILDDYGKTKNLAGQHFVQLGESSTLDDGTVVVKAKIARPKTTKTKDPILGGETEQQTYLIEDELIVLNKGGKGTSMVTEIKTKLTKENAAKFNQGYSKLKDVSREVEKSAAPDNSKSKPKTVVQGGFTYTLNEQTGQYE